MKKIFRSMTIIVFTLLSTTIFAQDINWKSLQPSQKNILSLRAGFDNGSFAGAAYSYRLNTKMPLLVGAEYSMQVGENVFDDFKAKLGAQMNIVRTSNFFATIKAQGIFRRYENPFVRMVNFGGEFSAVGGIYKKKWFAAADIGFDKAITTHIKHSDLMKEYNPDVQTGWYIPTGGNFLFGVQGGYSFGDHDVVVKVARPVAQDLKTLSNVPYLFQIGWNVKW